MEEFCNKSIFFLFLFANFYKIEYNTPKTYFITYVFMAEIKHNGKTFYISDEMQAEYPELIKLILATESMEDDEEKQYWFDIMPSMNDSQIDRLFNILETERKKLEELELKYQEEIKWLNEKHLIEWQEFQSRDAKKKIAQAEAEDQEEDPDEVLRMLNSL